jgi:hypothetical protein
MMPRRIGLPLLCLAIVSCGGGDAPGADPGSAIPINGGERISWEQPVESAAAAQAHAYILYVDGVARSLTGASCGDVRQPGGYPCSSPLPSMSSGRRRLELAASFNGTEGRRSAPLFVDVGGAAAASGLPTGQEASVAGGSPCLAAGSAGCYLGSLVAGGLGTVTSIVDGAERRVAFVIEDGRHLRLVAGGQVLPDPVLSVSGAGVRMLDLALAGDFATTGHLFVAWSVSSPDGSEMLSVTRYRELEGSLGEAATLVTGLPIPIGSSVHVAADDERRLYVALPAGAAYSSQVETGAAGVVLRFDADGTAADSNPRSSPVLSNGYAHPTELLWDGATRRVWLAGADPAWPAWVSTLAVDGAGVAPRWPLPIEALVDGAESAAGGRSFPSSMALTSGAAAGRPDLWLTVTDSGVVFHVPVSIDGGLRVQPPEATDFHRLGGGTMLAAGFEGALLVGTADPPTVVSVWELRPAPVVTIP